MLNSYHILKIPIVFIVIRLGREVQQEAEQLNNSVFAGN